MPALTISAVDHTTGQLTVTAHGQVTGAGPAALFAGSGGVIPTGLAGNTDLYLIVLDPNTVKLADSSTHALAGTALTFATNGTLPLQLLLGLPYRRPRTAAALTQVFSADNNSTWDSLVALWNLLTGQAQSIFGDIVLAAGQNIMLQGAGVLKHGARELDLHIGKYHTDSTAGLALAAVVVNQLGYITGFGGTGFCVCPIELEVGKRILSCTQYYEPNGTAVSITPSLHRMDLATGTDAPIWTGSADSVGAANVIKSQTGSSLNHVVLSGSAYFLQCLVSNGSHRVRGGSITYDRP